MSTIEPVDGAHERRLAGRYRLISMIGSGGTGTVWAAVDEVLGREVAVKDVVAPPWLSDEDRRLLRERTLREARAACRINHPNVVMIYDVIEQDDRPWIIMQLVRAPSLSQIIEEQGPRPPRWVAEMGLQILGALQAAHAHGILHRDVKPSNVLVDDGRAVLTDFGIATIDGEATLTAPNALVGAPSYIAPERVEASAAGPASDLWSLGATLYTAVEGRPPFLREGILAILTAVATDEPDPTSRAGALAPLLEALLRKDPTQRPSAAEVERSLRRIVALTDPEDDTVTGAASTGAASTGAIAVPDVTQTVIPAPHTSEPPQRQRPRRQVFAAAAGIAVLALLLLGALGQQAAIPGFPARQPAGEPATTVPVIGGSSGPSQPVAGQPMPNGPAGQTTVQPAAEAGHSSSSEPQPPATTTPGNATPTDTATPSPTTTSTFQEPTTTTTTVQPPAATSVTV